MDRYRKNDAETSIVKAFTHQKKKFNSEIFLKTVIN